MSSQNVAVLHLRVTAEPDPVVLAKVLERFQNLNVLPRRVVAEWSTADRVHIQVEVSDISESTLELITAKISQAPCILNAYWHHG